VKVLAVSVVDNWIALALTAALVGYLLLTLLLPERF
jgi:K+-transporting ATPase KdpF subunit